jgi:hypothetical protein
VSAIQRPTFASIGAVFQDYMCYDLSARDNVVVGDLSALHLRAGGARRQSGGVTDSRQFGYVTRECVLGVMVRELPAR